MTTSWRGNEKNERKGIKKEFLTIAESSDGGAVLAAGRVVDLLGAPPRLRGELFLGGCRGHDGIGSLPLWPAPRKVRRDEKLEDTQRPPGPPMVGKTHGCWASGFCTGFQERVMVLLKDGGLWKRSWWKDRRRWTISHWNNLWLPSHTDLDEYVDVVGDLQRHHFDLVLLSRKIMMLSKKNIDQRRLRRLGVLVTSSVFRESPVFPCRATLSCLMYTCRPLAKYCNLSSRRDESSGTSHLSLNCPRLKASV